MKTLHCHLEYCLNGYKLINALSKKQGGPKRYIEATMLSKQDIVRHNIVLQNNGGSGV